MLHNIVDDQRSKSRHDNQENRDGDDDEMLKVDEASLNTPASCEWLAPVALKILIIPSKSSEVDTGHGCAEQVKHDRERLESRVCPVDDGAREGVNVCMYICRQRE